MKKILIVEDQPEVSRLLEIALRGEGRQLLFAVSGEEGLAAARRSLPDLVLLDIMMPGDIDGLEVARRLKAEPQTARSPIVVVSARFRDQDRQEAFAAGADDYLTKPFDVVELRSKVERLLA